MQLETVPLYNPVLGVSECLEYVCMYVCLFQFRSALYKLC